MPATARLRLSPRSGSASNAEPSTGPAPSIDDRRHLRLIEPAARAVWTSPGAAPNGPMTTDRVRAATPAPRGLEAATDAAVIAAITRPLAPGESHQLGHAHKEQAVCALLGSLTEVQAFDLGRRLDADRDHDAVAVAFRRLAADRRQRVRRFLADARRRAACSRA